MSRSSVKETEMKQAARENAARPVPGVAAVVMAAGLGKRMHSKHAKVLHSVAGRAMVLYSVDLALRVAGDQIAVVVGHQADRVSQVIKDATGHRNGHVPISIVEQRELLGTGHAVLQTRPVFVESGRSMPGQFMILNGDTPLLREATMRELLEVHRRQEAAVTILTAVLDDASGYGRVVRSSSDECVSRIVEDRDADAAEKVIREINVGTYVVDGDFLFAALERLQPSNAQGEYYLTDIVQMAVEQGRRVAAVRLDDPHEGLGVNTRRQLAEAEQVVRRQIRDRWLDAGVTDDRSGLDMDRCRGHDRERHGALSQRDARRDDGHRRGHASCVPGPGSPIARSAMELRFSITAYFAIRTSKTMPPWDPSPIFVPM